MKVVKVLQKGQIVIPKEIREAVGIKVGSKVIVEKMEKMVVVIPEPKDPLKEMVGLFEEFKPKEPSWKIIKKMRREWDERLEKEEKLARG